MGNSSGWLGALISGGFATAQQGAQMAYDASQAKKNREFQAEEAEKNRAYQTEEANVNRLFQSNEAALQRDWSSQEAERAMDWQEEMYAKYNSLSGKIAQAEQAGVNPMLAITGNAVSPMSASASAPSGASASGSQAGSVGTPSGDSASMAFVDIIGKVLGFKQVQSQINVDNALAEKYRKESEGQSITNETLREWNVTQILEARSRIEYNNENTSLVTSKILNTDADTEKKYSELSQIASSIANMEADTAVKQQQISVMLSDIAKNNKSIEFMDEQIYNLWAHNDVLNAEYNNLVQEHGHQSVMNAITEISASRDTGAGEHSNGYYRVLSETKRFINSLLGWWSGNTSIEVPHKKPARIGFK